MSFDLADYVDVAERIRIFRDKHPEGSLQSDITLVKNTDGFLIGVLCKATAHRTPDDPIPGNGHSYLGVPGKTPYTKDSEVENAETSAWGRAIVAALAADTKKVASADEVRAKQDSGSVSRPGGQGDSGRAGSQSGDADSPAPKFTAPPAGAGDHGDWVVDFGKHKGTALKDLPLDYVTWFVDNGKKPEVVARFKQFLNPAGEGSSFYDANDIDSDVPFAPTIDGWGF